jgi:succinylglutamate desuccinylase
MSFKILNDYLSDLLANADKDRLLIEGELNGCSIQEHSKGILSFTPKTPSSSSPLILSCGIHGNETAPIEIINDILKKIAKKELKIQRPLLVIFGHIEAMKAHKRFIDFNLNRLFSGEHLYHASVQESPRALELESIVDNFFHKHGKGWHLDLHTAIRPSHIKRFAVFPTIDNHQPTLEEITILKAIGIEAILLANEKAKTFSSFSFSKHQAFAYTLELGKVEPFGENLREDFKEAERTLEQLIANQEIPSQENKNLKLFTVVHEMIRDSEDYTLHLSEDYANFSPLTVNAPIETTQEGILKAKVNQAVVFPNSHVIVGQRTGLLVEIIKEV